MSQIVSMPMPKVCRPIPSLDSVAERVRGVLLRVVKPPSRSERRGEDRHPFPYPVHLTPLTASGTPDVEQTTTGLGKHLSDHGLDFYSFQPLAFRRTIVTLEPAEGDLIGLLLDLKWCRFTRYSWYENGGRFIELVDSPLIDKTEPPLKLMTQP